MKQTIILGNIITIDEKRPSAVALPPSVMPVWRLSTRKPPKPTMSCRRKAS